MLDRVAREGAAGTLPLRALTDFWVLHQRHIDDEIGAAEYWTALLQVAAPFAGLPNGRVLGLADDGALAVWAKTGESLLLAPYRESLARRVIEAGGPLWLPTVPPDGLVAEAGPIPALALATLVLPLQVGAGAKQWLMGALCLEGPSNGLTAGLIDFLAGLANFAAEGAHTRARHERWRGRFNDLLETTKRLELVMTAERLKRRDALTDEVSGLVNRAFFEYVGPTLVATAHRYDFPLSLIMLSLAEAPGTRPLISVQWKDLKRALGEQLLLLCRSCDTIAHVADQQFALLLPHTDEAGARMLAERLAALVPPLRVPGMQAPLRCRIGVAQLAPAATAQALVEAAEREMRGR